MRNRPGLPSYVQVQRCQHSEEDGGDSITPETAVVNLNQGTFVAKPRLNSDAGKNCFWFAEYQNIISCIATQ